MRKTLVKEVTSTTVKVARMEIENGQPIAVNLPDVILLGNVSLEKAQKIVNKEYGGGTVFGVQAETKTYVMSVEEFIKVASLKEDGDGETSEQLTASI
jgi:hypothetical protein